MYAYNDVTDSWYIDKQIPSSYHMWDVTMFKDHMYIGGSYVGLTEYPVVRIEDDGSIVHIPFYYSDADYQKDYKAGTVSNTIHHLDLQSIRQELFQCLTIRFKEQSKKVLASSAA